MFKVILTAAFGLVASTAANAAVYDFVGVNSSVQITTGAAAVGPSADGSVGGYYITDITGSIAGFGNIEALAPTPTAPNSASVRNSLTVPGGTDLIYDNLFFPGNTSNTGNSLDLYGVAFQIATPKGSTYYPGPLFADISSNGSPGSYDLFIDWGTANVSGGAVVAAVPETSTWAMMILGFCRNRLHGLSAKEHRRSALRLIAVT